MNRRIKIKVIKKGEIKKVEPPVAAQDAPPPDNTNKLSSTVSSWVNEFQERRREETETAREQFYS